MTSVQFKNTEELVEFFKNNEDAIKKLLGASSLNPAAQAKPDAFDALGQRDVVSEARTAATAPAVTKDTLPLAPRKALMPVVSSNKDGTKARNTMRLIHGTSYVFEPITSFGDNWYNPDFRLNHRLLHRANLIIMANKRFYDSSEFFHPLVAHIYLGVIEMVHAMRVARGVSKLGYHANNFLSWFETTFELSALPIPGFLRSQFSTMASSSPAIASYDNVFPMFNSLPRASQLSRYTMSHVAATGEASPLSYRVTNVTALLEQYSQVLALANAQAITDYATFGHTVFGTAILAPVAAPSPYSQSTIVAGMPQAVACLLGSPGYETDIWTPNPVATTLFSYRQQALNLMPPFPAAVTATAEITWAQYMSMDQSHQWFIEFARVMSFYSQFFNDGCSLGSVPIAGNAAGQITFHVRDEPRDRPAVRFPDLGVALTAEGRLANMSIPEADAMDATIGMLNSGKDYRVTGDPRGGPFFDTLPLRQRTRTLTPESGYGQILVDHYRLTNPVPPTVV